MSDDTAPQTLEFRPDCDGEFDEIVARFADGMVHVETMTDKSCYVGFYWDDGRYCQWWINSKKKLSYHHGHGRGPAPRFNAWGIEQNGPAKVDTRPEGGDEGNTSAPALPSGAVAEGHSPKGGPA